MDLSGNRAETPPGAVAVPFGQSGAPPVRAIGTAAPVDPARPRRYAILAEHRRRLRRAVVRRWELTVWCTAAVVVATMVAFVVGGLPLAAGGGRVSSGAAPEGLASRGSGIPGPGALIAPSASGNSCFLVPCDRPTFAAPPTVLRIPALGVVSTLESLVVDAANQLQPPTDYSRAGWWTTGVAPGDVGAAVIAGHVDSRRSGAAVFYNLHKLKAGDRIEVDRGGQTVVFSVTEVQQYPKNRFPAGRVYQPTPDAELRLITCGGQFDRTLLSYRDNIVVYAILA